MEYEKMNLEYVTARIVIGSYDFTNHERRIDSIVITTGAYDGSVPGVGCAYSATCTIQMENIDAVAIGQRIKVYFYNSNGSSKYMGMYFVDSQPVRGREMMTLNCHGTLDEWGDDKFYYPSFVCSNVYKTVNDTLASITEQSEMSVVFDDNSVNASENLKGTRITGMCSDEPGQHGTSLVDNKPIIVDQKEGITNREYLQGLAVLYGGNVVEREGVIHFIPFDNNEGYEDYTFPNGSYDDDYTVSAETYILDKITAKFIPWVVVNHVFGVSEPFTATIPEYEGTDKTALDLAISERTGYVPGDDSVLYCQEIDCDWLSYILSYFGDYASGNAFKFAFHTGSFSFSGYNDRIVAGKVIKIELPDGKVIPFFVGECTLTWDGGITTEISCNCSIGKGTNTGASSIASSGSGSSNSFSGMNNQNKINFADITLSNVEDSTISGSKFIDGSITGSKIEDSTIINSKILKGSLEGSSFKDGTITNSLIADSTLTGAKIKDATIGFAKVDQSFIADLTANEAYITNLIAETAKLGYVTADEVNSQIGQFGYLTADSATIKSLQAQDVEITGSLSALYGQFNTLNAKAITTDNLSAKTAELGYMTAEQADLKYADIKLGNIETADIGLLFANVGLIDRATIIDGHVTGFLDAVEVNADKITAGTLVTDRLVIRDSADPTKSIIYEINNISGALQAVQGNTLNGEVLTDRTINAAKIIAKSITASELDVEKIFANSAVLNTIFAQDITATGTIEGVTLKGATGEFSGKITADTGIIGGFGIIENNLLSSFEKTVNGTKRTYTVCINADENALSVPGSSLPAAIATYDHAEGETQAIYPWYVTYDGYMHAVCGDIGGFSIDENSLYADFVHNGYDFSAKINAKSEAWLIEEKMLSGGIEYGAVKLGVSGINVSGRDAGEHYNHFAGYGQRRLVIGAEGVDGDSYVTQAPYNGEWNAVEIDSGHAAGTPFSISPSALFNIPTTINNTLTVNKGLTAKNDISLNGALEIVHATPYIDFHFGKSAADYTTRLIESESGKLTCTGTFKANVLYEGGKSLANKYCVVKTGTKSAVGTGGWKQYQVSFGVTYATEPFVNVMDTSKFATENVNFDGYIGDSTNGYTGFYYSVYTPTTTFTYTTRWWSVGRVK